MINRCIECKKLISKWGIRCYSCSNTKKAIIKHGKYTKLYKIDLPYSTFGIEVLNGVVINSAPIARWMIGESLKYIKEWVKKKEGTIFEVIEIG